jgi:N-acetylmuramoyl-L-alanine amidase
MKLLLDAGHSGTVFGEYYTAGKRSPEVPPGIYEGEWNREVCESVVWSVGEEDVCFLNPGPYSVPLEQRVEFINQIAKREKGNVILLSVHANASGSGNEWSKANGYCAFTQKRYTEAEDRFAKLLVENMVVHTMMRNRGVKRKGFSILRVNCPAVLLECGFMTNRDEVHYLQNDGLRHVIRAIGYAWEDMQ